MANASRPHDSHDLPPLPDYSLQPLPSYFSWCTDEILQVALPIIGYWLVSLAYHLIDVYDLCAKYRLHTPAEVLKRNHVSRYDVFRDVIIQQVIQTIAGLLLSLTDDPATYGRADHDVAWYAQKIRLAQRAVPVVLAAAGVDPGALAAKVSTSQPTLACVLAGGRYPALLQTITTAGQEIVAPAFASWEMACASALYWFIVPAVQFSVAVMIIDTWEYFCHRAMHMNKWLYATLHSRHHRLYVPYAYGALYNHPVEGFILDTLGAGLGYLVTGMTLRQSLFFFTGSTIKTVLDHSGYEFPWDPLHWVFPNNAAYHDIHHQSWGIKSNFSQPYFTFWDRVSGTMWEGDVTAKYERSRRTAEEKLAQEIENETLPAEAASTMATALDYDENARPQPMATSRTTRKKSSSVSNSPAGNFKGLRNKVNGSLHGSRANVLGVESSH
ncbi:hypothetical protein P280DRAFT_295406 [Massarina eburnea CBS 473.64]|uniref:Fatty acid hydroxylase domain-containing protein n=1 Tax=Massarina eburnea CBS 473.64 TaxID=1395130 RepID=A0A6A6S6U0_9PLEO|nr:hypothetical protein P280DRAFT_295406 [Massarina eburnea CBS 473.64]